MASRYRYLEWVLANYPRARFNLANSAVATPPRELLGDAFGAAPPLEPGRLERPAAEAVAAAAGVAAARVVLSLGTSGANHLVYAAHVAPGDVVAVEEPTYEPLRLEAEARGARVVVYPAHDAAGLARALDAAGGRCTLVVASSPQNPTARVMTADEGKALAAEAERRGARFLVDEVYRDALVDPPPSATALGAIVTSSLTKSYGLGAIRFGWAIAPDAAAAAALQEISFGTIGAHAQPLLALGIAALERREALLAHARATIALNHARFAEACAAASGRIVPAPAPAGVIVWAELPGVPDAQLFAERLLAEQATLVSPGGFFGPPGCVRMGLGGDPEVVRAGLARLGAALA